MTDLARDALVLGYAGLVGLVAAGIVASFYQWVTSEPARFSLFGTGTLAMVSTFVFCALTGPIIMLDKAIGFRRSEGAPVSWMFAGLFITVLWSCCSGIVVLGTLLALSNGIA